MSKNAEYFRRKERRRHLRQFGLTIETHAALVAGQDGACAKCGEKPAGGQLWIAYDRERACVVGLYCPSCGAAFNYEQRVGLPPRTTAERRQRATEQRRRARLQKYGLTEDTYQALLRAQDENCAACGSCSDRTLVVDYDRERETARALLCVGCYAVIRQCYGKRETKVQRICAVANYLQRGEGGPEGTP